jgi:hypothetical protein
MGEKKNVCLIVVGKAEGKRQFGRSGCTWKDNIKMCLKEIEWEGLYWINMAQDRDMWRAVVDTVMNLRVP